MKKIIFLFMALFGFLLAGCSVDMDGVSKKAEDFGEKADELGVSFEKTADLMDKLEEKETLSSKDQERVVKRIEDLTEGIDEFKKEDAPFLAKTAKKVAMKKLNEKKVLLKDVKEKASNRTAEPEDLTILKESLSENIEINLF
jgi:hypothetical protein